MLQKARVLFVVLTVVMFCIPAYSLENQRIVETVISSDSSSTINVPNTTTIYTKSISLKQLAVGDKIGILYRGTSNGVMALSIKLEQGVNRPTTEGSADSNYLVTDILETALATVDSSGASKWKLATIDTVVMPFARFEIKGGSTNTGGTQIQLKVIK